MSWKGTKPDFSFAKLSEKYSVSNYINSILLRIFNVVKFISSEKVTLDILCYAELIQYIYAYRYIDFWEKSLHIANLKVNQN